MDAFPWDRLKAAQRYLYALKPWWKRFGDLIQVMPIDVPHHPDERYSGMTSSSDELFVYVDLSFAISAPIPLLAGAFEFELQMHARNSQQRLLYLPPRAYARWANICLALEVNSSLRAEYAKLTIDGIRVICSRSMTFTREDMERWMVNEPPLLTEGAWLPGVFGLPDKLSAEEYYQLLTTDPSPPDPDDVTSQSSTEDEAETEEAPRDGPGQPQDASSDAEEDQDQDQDERSDADNDTESVETADDGLGDDRGDTQPDDEVDAQEDAPSSMGSGDEDRTPNDGERSPVESPESGEGEPEQSEPDASEQGAEEDGGEEDSSEDSSESGDVENGDADSATREQRSAEIAASARSSDPGMDWYASAHPDPRSDAAPSWMPNQKDSNGVLKSDARKQLSADIKEALENPGMGMSPGGQMIDIARDVIRASGGSWMSILNRVISSSVLSAKVSGQSDLSYSVRNPNQPNIGPILLGMHDYAPVIYVVQDVSFSMRRFLERSLGDFKSVLRAAAARYSDGVTWITVDASVQDVGRTMTLDQATLNRIGRGLGGTHIAETLIELHEGNFRFDGRRYPRADLIVLNTDCEWRWPWQDIKMLKGPRVIVCSPKPYSEVERYLPPWVIERRNFVHVKEDEMAPSRLES